MQTDAPRFPAHGMQVLLLWLACLALLGGWGSAAPTDPGGRVLTPAQSEVWLCAGDRIRDLQQPGAEWPFVKQHLSGIKLYIGQLGSGRPQATEDPAERLRHLVRLVRTHDLQVAVELGGCLDFSPMDDTAGEWSARHELAALERFYAAGGRVDYLDLDGPIRRLLHPQNRRDGQCFDSNPHPKQMMPETAPNSMTALVKAVTELVMLPVGPGGRGGGQPSKPEVSFLRRHLKLEAEQISSPTRISLIATPDRPAPSATTQRGSDRNPELAKWDDAAKHRPQAGPGGSAWDGPYRSFIQTDENAASKGLPTHAQAAKQILADAAKSPDNLRRHKGWVLFIKHFSQAYRPDSATADLKRLFEDLVAMEFGGAARLEILSFDGDARLTLQRDVVYGKAASELQRLDAYLVKSERPTPVLIEFHGGGWRRGAKSQFNYPAGLIESILAAGVSVVSVDYRLTSKHPFPAQFEDAARAVQFVRSKAKEWNLDPERIVAMGGSAGAHLSAWVALHDDQALLDSPDPVERHSTRLRGFVDLWGPMDLTRVRPTQLAKAGLRGADFADAFTAAFACTAEAFEQNPAVRQRVREASPLFLVTRDDPPALILHTAGEDLGPGKHPPIPEVINDPHSAWHGVLLANAMRAAGIDVVCRIGPQVGKDPAADNETIVSFILHGPRTDRIR